MTTRRTDHLALGAALLIPPLLLVALVPFRDALGGTNVALIAMAFVVAVATTGRRTAAVLAALSAAAWFDFLHTEPYFSFAIDRRDDLISVGLLLAAGLIVSQVAIWGRRQQTHAERTINEVAALRSVAELVATGEDRDVVTHTASFWLSQLLPLRSAHFEPVHARSAETASPPAEVKADGSVHVGSLRWHAAHQGLPGPEVWLGVRHGDHLVGHFVLEPEPGQVVTEDRLFTAAALADQVGAAFASTPTR